MFAVLLASVTYRRGRLKGGVFLYWILVATDFPGSGSRICSRHWPLPLSMLTRHLCILHIIYHLRPCRRPASLYLLHPCSRVLTRHFPHPVDRVRQNDDSKDYWDLIRAALAYNVENDTLQILRVIHSKQDWPQAFY